MEEMESRIVSSIVQRSAIGRYWGDLRRLIDLRRQLNQGPFTNVVAKRIMLEIAEGMEVLHKLGIVHGDVKASNISIVGHVIGDPKESNISIKSLIDDVHGDTEASTMGIKPLVKESGLFDPMDDAFMDDAFMDDGFSCVLGDYECSLLGRVGTGFWRAPEILEIKLHGRKVSSFTEKIDVYSYSMTCFEVLTGLYPFEDLYPFNYYNVVINGKRPDLPRFIEDGVKSLLSRCWHSDPSKRPTFVQICEQLRIMNRGNSKPIPLQPPLDNEEPLFSEPPLDNKEPLPSEPPLNNKEPLSSELPLDIKEPLQSEPPLDNKKPLLSEPPLDIKEPLLSEPPLDIKEPLPSEPPLDNKEPLLSEPPLDNKELLPLEPPLDNEELLPSELPLDNEEPLHLEQPLDNEENLELLTELLMLLEPISIVLASFIDFGHHIFACFIQWSRVMSRVDSFKSKRSYDFFKSMQFLGQGFSGFNYETTWLTWYGIKRWGRFARKDFPRVHSLVFEIEATRLVNLEHPNVVKVFCWTVERLGCSLVMEFVKTDIESVVEKKRGLHNITSSFKPFQHYEAVYIMMHIARAMEYLYSDDVGIGHGDLRPNNILVDLEVDPMIVKVVDFGLVESKKRSMLVSKHIQFVRTLEWKAPEIWKDLPTLIDSGDDDSVDEDFWEELDTTVQEDGTARELADVYSFAITCIYIMGGTISYPKPTLHQLQQISSGTLRPEIPNCTKFLREIIESSWNSYPEKRPRFSDLRKQLEEYLKLVEQTKQTKEVKREEQRKNKEKVKGRLNSTLTRIDVELTRRGIDGLQKIVKNMVLE